MRRLGLFGGTFDPPHLGHLALAECARERLKLERVIFMPSGIPPHKRRPGISPALARVAMTRLAVRDNPAFQVSTLESRRPGASYTVDTLRALKAEEPEARIYLMIGEDSLDELPTWHQPAVILELATLAVARRPRPTARRTGARRRLERLAPRRLVWLDGPALEISSSAIRARVKAGRSIRYLVTDRVDSYEARHHLYRGGR